MIEIFDCEQRSEAWFRCRMGLATASEFATIMASGRGGGESKGRRTYMLKLAGEIITGEPMENYTNNHIERGRIMEEEARDYYAFLCNDELTRVGFIKNGPKGASPDSLIGTKGMLEIKTALPHILADLLLKDEVPPEHKAQCQGQLWVCEREWIDIAVYWPKMPVLVKRAVRDEAYIKQIETAVDAFNAELAQTVDKLRRYGELGEKAA